MKSVNNKYVLIIPKKIKKKNGTTDIIFAIKSNIILQKKKIMKYLLAHQVEHQTNRFQLLQ